jgi:hypothetical protein
VAVPALELSTLGLGQPMAAAFVTIVQIVNFYTFSL